MATLSREKPPSSARVVIIGGGVVGTSCLYHLAKMGWSDCVLLEKNELTSGSTWHAAGNCPNFSGSWSIMKMQNYSTELYRRLGDDVDYPMNYHITGSIRLAHSNERMQEFQHVCSMARYQGIEFAMMSNSDMPGVSCIRQAPSLPSSASSPSAASTNRYNFWSGTG